MSYGKFFVIVFMTVCIALLSACQGKNKNAKKEVSQFVASIETASKAGALEHLKKPVEIESVVYNGSDLRDPFAMPTVNKNARKYPGTILSEASLDTLKLTGIVFHHDRRWAIFRAGDGKLYKISEGMRVGLQHALLVQISKEDVKFSVDEEGSDEKQHDVVMTIQESAQ